MHAPAAPTAHESFEIGIVATELLSDSSDGWIAEWRTQFADPANYKLIEEITRCRVKPQLDGTFFCEGKWMNNLPKGVILSLEGNPADVASAIEDFRLQKLIQRKCSGWFPIIELRNSKVTNKPGECHFCHRGHRNDRPLITHYPKEKLITQAKEANLVLLNQQLKLYYHKDCVRCSKCPASPTPLAQ